MCERVESDEIDLGFIIKQLLIFNITKRCQSTLKGIADLKKQNGTSASLGAPACLYNNSAL